MILTDYSFCSRELGSLEDATFDHQDRDVPIRRKSSMDFGVIFCETTNVGKLRCVLRVR